MLRLFVEVIVKPGIILTESCMMGLLFGILPCHIFPLFGGDTRTWCGCEDKQPRFVLQFFMGYVLTLVVTIYFTYFKFDDLQDLTSGLVYKPFLVIAAGASAWIITVNVYAHFGRSKTETCRIALFLTLAALAPVIDAIYF